VLACARRPLLACRKNKTLGAIFRQGSTLALLEQNHAVAAALHRAADGGQVDLVAAVNALAVDAEARQEAGGGGGDSDEDMEEDGLGEGGSGGGGGGAQRRRRGKASEGFKEQVLEVLQGGGYADRRAAKMSQDDLLALLAAFNQAGIHFA
jgi:18S rRNA (adenine1779-N6/adenine1780-N6)-dimethyltransferase